jgi:DNA helicase-2/ATP-dependent DNA helicase PcrA
LAEREFKPTKEQFDIISCINGALLVLAPVGTGKTQVLAERMAKAIGAGFAPERILCLTFTNRAAQEMRDRAMEVFPAKASRVMVRTFHGFCSHFLRIEARLIGIASDFVIYDDEDSLELLRKITRDSSGKKARELWDLISKRKIHAPDTAIGLDVSDEALFSGLGAIDEILKYQRILHGRHAVDFADLVYLSRAALKENNQISERWGRMFDFIQVDEVQDTHMSEYRVVSHLAQKCRNLAMIGDLDQTIYEWRGSEPHDVLESFVSEYDPVVLNLTENYRATKKLILAAASFASSLEQRQTECLPAPSCEEGDNIVIHAESNPSFEAEWIAAEIKKIAGDNAEFEFSKIAVLTRTNKRAVVVHQAMDRNGIPCVTVETYQFFQRQEIKDAIAYLRLLLNPYDTGAMQRVLLRPSRGIGDETIRGIVRGGQSAGLRLTDFISTSTLEKGDPFHSILAANRSGDILIFDVETTGKDVERDEVIEIGYVFLENGKRNEYETIIRNNVEVGQSFHIHGLSDDLLRSEGEPARKVLSDFLDIAQNKTVVGHNVGFDRKMLAAHSRRLGLAIPDLELVDTLDLSRRFVQATSYRLNALANQLGLEDEPTHRALDDVRTTEQLLRFLIPLIEETRADRMKTVNDYGSRFVELAQNFAKWRKAVAEVRPVDLLVRLLDESGLREFYKDDQKRIRNLQELVTIFENSDDAYLAPETSLRSLLEYTALARNVDHLDPNQKKVLILTIHQAKGLEFNTVFLAGASDGEIPLIFAIDEERLEEEKRIFYVGMTRARKKLYISYFREIYQYSKEPSRFIDLIAEDYLEKE